MLSFVKHTNLYKTKSWQQAKISVLNCLKNSKASKLEQGILIML